MAEMSERDRAVWAQLLNTPPSQLPASRGSQYSPSMAAATGQPMANTNNPYGYAAPAAANDPMRYGPNGTRIDPALGYEQADRNGKHQTNLQYGLELNRQFGRGFEKSANQWGREDFDLAAQFANDPRAYQEAVARRNIFQTGGFGPEADVSRYMLGGNAEWAGNRLAQFDARAAQMSAPSRYQPMVDGSIMGQASLAGRAAQAGDAVGGVAGQFGGVANQIGGAATGVGYQGQMDVARALYGMGQQPQGPSAAEMAMRQQAGEATRQNAAMAASGRGANAGLAMQNAATGNATIQGDLIARLGQQRAAEDLAYRNQRMQALGAAGGAYQGAMGSQLNAYGQQANVLGGQGQMLGQQAGIYGAAGQGLNAAGNTALAGGQQEIARDDAARAYYSLGNQVAGQDLGANMAYDASRTGNFLGYHGIERGVQAQEAAESRAFGRQLISGALQAGGAIAGGMVGGPAGAAAGAYAGGAAGGAIGRR